MEREAGEVELKKGLKSLKSLKSLKFERFERFEEFRVPCSAFRVPCSVLFGLKHSAIGIETNGT